MWNLSDAVVYCSSPGSRSVVLYCILILMVLYASHLQRESQVLIATGTNEVTQALRLSAIVIMEQNEYQMLQIEEVREENLAQEYHRTAHEYAVKAKHDGVEAAQSRTRSEYYANLTEIDAHYENITYHKMFDEDQVRLEVFHNITQVEDDIAASHQKEMEMEKNPCYRSWSLFENVCTILHIIPQKDRLTTMESEKNTEIQKLVREREQYSEVKQQEYIYGLITAILQGYVTQYNRTAHELWQSSLEWEMQMQRDGQVAHQQGEIASEYKMAVRDIQHQIQEEQSWQESNTLKSNTLFHEASYHIQLSRNYTKLSMALGVLSLIYFVTQWWQRFLGIFTVYMNYDSADSTTNNYDRDNDQYDATMLFVWRISYVVNYLLLFAVVVVGGIHHSTMLHPLETTTTAFHNDFQYRFISTVATLSFCTAMLQTIFLHAIPNILYSSRGDVRIIKLPSMEYFSTTILRSIGVQFLIRMMLYMIASALQFIAIWLLDGGKYLFVTLEEGRCYNYNAGLVPLLFVTITLHICYLEKHSWNLHDDETLDEQATFLMNQSHDGFGDDDVDDEISNATSIATSSSSFSSPPFINSARSKASVSPTESMPFIFMNRLAAAASTTPTANQQPSTTYIASSKRLNMPWESMKLLLLLDTLLVTCSFVILRGGSNSSTGISSIVMVWLAGTLTCGVVLTAFILYAYLLLPPRWIDNDDDDEQQHRSIDSEKRISFSKSFNTYNSIDV